MTDKDLKKIISEVIKADPQSEKELFNIARKISGKLKLPPPEKSGLLSAYHKIIKKQPHLKNTLLEKLLT